MPNYTETLKLLKPTEDEFYNVAVPNANMDALDTYIKELQEQNTLLRAELSNKANILISNTTFYVSSTAPTGGIGTQAAPFRTVQEAVDALPVVSNKYSATIRIAGGDYVELVQIQGVNYTVTLMGDGEVTMGGLNVFSCARVTLDNLRIRYDSSLEYIMSEDRKGLLYIVNSMVYCTSSLYIAGTYECAGIILEIAAVFGGSGTPHQMQINGCAVGILALSSSNSYLMTLPAADPVNQIGVRAIGGGTVAYATMASGFATTQISTANGGRVNTGAQ